MRLSRRYTVVYILCLVLAGSALYGLFSGRLEIALVGLITLALTLAPFLIPRLFGIRLPSGFITAIALFLCATLFLGEVGDFYERIWWWDIVLHGGSAIGIGLVGVVLMLILLRGERIAAAPILISLFAFCFAVTVGVFWEIFEFCMDWFFGFNMQKSGLVDTMTDLMVDCLGAAIGAGSGFLYLKEKQAGGPAALIAEFVEKNRRLFVK